MRHEVLYYAFHYIIGCHTLATNKTQHLYDTGCILGQYGKFFYKLVVCHMLAISDDRSLHSGERS